MPSPNPEPDPKRNGHSVRVVSCYASMCGGPSGCSPRAVLSFSRGHQVLEPYLLSVLQVRVLIEDMIRVLATLERPDDRGGSSATVMEGTVLPPIPALLPRKGQSKKRPPPSRHPSSPTGPIQPTEVWRLHSLLKNVKSHDDFLKLIGANHLPLDTGDRADPPQTATTPKPKASRKTAKKPVSRPPNPLSRKKRKEK